MHLFPPRLARAQRQPHPRPRPGKVTASSLPKSPCRMVPQSQTGNGARGDLSWIPLEATERMSHTWTPSLTLLSADGALPPCTCEGCCGLFSPVEKTAKEDE